MNAKCLGERHEKMGSKIHPNKVGIGFGIQEKIRNWPITKDYSKTAAVLPRFYTGFLLVGVFYLE